MLHFDHVIAAVRDLDVAAEVVRSAFGWGVSGGGRHPGGTHNRAVALGGTEYLELLAPYDETLPTGRAVSQRLSDGEGWFGWALRDDDLDATASRVGLTIHDGSIETNEGTRSWRIAGAEGSGKSQGGLPFLIDYGIDRTDAWTDRYAEADHLNAPAGIGWVEVGADQDEVRLLLGDSDLDVRVVDGRSGLRAVGITLADGEAIEIRDWPTPSLSARRSE